VPHLATCIFLFFYNEPELGVEIDPGMALTPLPSTITSAVALTRIYAWICGAKHVLRDLAHAPVHLLAGGVRHHLHVSLH